MSETQEHDERVTFSSIFIHWNPDFCAFRACLHGGGGPQVGEVTRLGGVIRLSI